MKLALFGREISVSNYDKLELLLNTIIKYKESGHNIEIFYYKKFYDNLLNAGIHLPDGKYFDNYKTLPGDTDLFFSLGGDGTLLEAATLIRDRHIPVAGINFGRLGFLTVSCNDILKLLYKDFSIEKRSLLNFECSQMPQDFFPYALNEISIQRRDTSMLEINVSVDGIALPTYIADGILIATATGSTAYSLSVGGPIAFPDTKVLILSPIAPHNLNVRPLIISELSTLDISFTGRSSEALLTADNRYFKITEDTRISVTKADFTLNCVSVNNNFIAALNQKLLWGEDKRNKS